MNIEYRLDKITTIIPGIYRIYLEITLDKGDGEWVVWCHDIKYMIGQKRAQKYIDDIAALVKSVNDMVEAGEK